MSFKRVKVVMLPTNEKSKLVLSYRNELAINWTHDLAKFDDATYQNLYFISDEEIKEGDWYYNHKEYYKGCYRRTPETDDKSYLDFKKIIATTDKSLNLPQPSQSFIEKYIEEYNKGNVITEVMVEYEGICSNCEEYHEQSILCSDRDGFDAQIEPFRLKVNPKDNTITIRKIKDSWNREEVIRLLLDFNNDKPGAFDCSGWIEENL